VLQNVSSSVKMDLYVTTPGQNQSEIFFITLNNNGREITADAYERTTNYGPYAICKDKGVETALCVCNKSVENCDFFNPLSKHLGKIKVSVANNLVSQATNRDMVVKTFPYNINNDQCMFVIQQTNSAGITYDFVNFCNRTVELTFNIETRNLVHMSKPSATVQLRPLDMRFMYAGVEDKAGVKWAAKHTVTVV